MTQKQIEKKLYTGAKASPVIFVAGVAALAGAGYLFWRNRSQIQKFVSDQDLDGKFSDLKDFVSENASKLNGVLHTEAKSAISNASDKVQEDGKSALNSAQSATKTFNK